MKFDKSKVYTALNADELKVGSKVIVDDTLGSLKSRVEAGGYEFTLCSIEDESTEYRFRVDNGLGDDMFALAYLVSEPSKLKWTDLKVGDVICKGDLESMVIAIDKTKNKTTHFHILAYEDSSYELDWIGDKDLEGWEKIENGND